MRQASSDCGPGRSALVAVVLVTVFSSHAVAGEFYHHFGGEATHPALKVYGKDVNQFVRRESSALRITLPSNPDGRKLVGVSPVFSLAGDFEITFGYQILKADAGPDNQVGVNMRVMAGNPVRQTADLGRYRGLGNQDGFVAKHVTDFDKEERQEDIEIVPAKMTYGRLRLERKGTTLHYLVAEGREDDFRELRQASFIPDDCKVRFATVAGKGQTLDVRYFGIRIRADDLPNAQPEWTRKSRAWVWWVLGAIVSAGCVVGFFLWRRKVSSTAV